MSAKDIAHTVVRRALEKDGWRITHDPYYLNVGGVEMFIDLGAEEILAAERDDRKIAVEIKSFVSPSSISEFHKALGQFINYKLALEEKDPHRELYLAAPSGTYNDFLTLPFIQKVIRRQQLKLIIFDNYQEAIAQWIN